MNERFKLAFADEMSKLAISAGLALRAVQGRVAQGARVAPGILSSMGTAAAAGGRATPMMGSVVRNAGQDVRATMGMNRALANPTTQAMQQRVGNAIKYEAGGATTRTTSPLSSGYEGYMTDAQSTYTRRHMGQVLGVNPATIKMRTGQTQMMKDLGEMPGLAAAPRPAGAAAPAAVGPMSLGGGAHGGAMGSPAIAPTEGTVVRKPRPPATLAA